jgi:hypothetical protein
MPDIHLSPRRPSAVSYVTEVLVEKTQVGGSSCVHHWIIASPIGDTSSGVCRLCGAQRDFYNSSEPKFAIHRKDASATAGKGLQQKAS